MQRSQTHTVKTRSGQTLVQDLPELALNRRMPRIEREGERAIACDAQESKRAALRRICKLEQVRCRQGRPTASQETA